MTDDIIDRLAAIPPGSALDTARRQRAQARDNAQLSFALLLTPEDPAGFTQAERWAVAAFIAALHEQPDCAAFYAEGLAARDPALAPRIAAEARNSAGRGPYGAYPPGPLSAENAPGPDYPADPALGPRLAAALSHAQMLVLHPRDAAPFHLQALVAAGWTTGQIVTLSQLAAFLSFQIRAVAGFRAMLAA
jgi:CMD domain protein